MVSVRLSVRPGVDLGFRTSTDGQDQVLKSRSLDGRGGRRRRMADAIILFRCDQRSLRTYWWWSFLVGSRNRRWNDWDYVCVCVCCCRCCRYVLDMARVRHIVPDPFDDNLRLVIFSDLLYVERERKKERHSPNFANTSFHRYCGIWSDPRSLWVFILWCTETARVMVFVTSLFASVVLPSWLFCDQICKDFQKRNSRLWRRWS